MSQINQNKPSSSGSIMSVFRGICTAIAWMLVFHCNKSVQFGSFFMACCCPEIYIIYRFFTSTPFCHTGYFGKYKK